jgi:hypothetical protein
MTPSHSRRDVFGANSPVRGEVTSESALGQNGIGRVLDSRTNCGILASIVDDFEMILPVLTIIGYDNIKLSPFLAIHCQIRLVTGAGNAVHIVARGLQFERIVTFEPQQGECLAKSGVIRL